MLERVFTDLAKEDIAEIKRNMVSINPNGFGPVSASGTASQSLGFVLTKNGYQIISTGRAEAYILNIETGQKPGAFPDFTSLVKWVELRNIAKGRLARRAAYAIARSIAARGSRTWQNYGSKGKGTGILTSPASTEAVARKQARVGGMVTALINEQITKVYGS